MREKWPNPAAFDDVCEELDTAVIRDQSEREAAVVAAGKVALSRARGEDVSAVRDAIREDVK